MSDPIVNGVTCRNCSERGTDANGVNINRSRRLLAEVWWHDPPLVRIVGRFNQEAVRGAWALPGQPPSPRPLTTPADKGRTNTQTVTGDELVEVHGHGCGAGFK